MDKSKLGLAAPPRGLVVRLEEARVLRPTELNNLLRQFQPQWTLAEGLDLQVLIEWFINHRRLRELVFESEIGKRAIARFVWREASVLQIALSIAPKAYLCHATAASIHGLLTYTPDTIYINQEQSMKPSPTGPVKRQEKLTPFRH